MVIPAVDAGRLDARQPAPGDARRLGEAGQVTVNVVTIERLERALALAAYIVMLDGPIAAPLFDRLERELAAARATNGTVARAKALLESYRTTGALKAIA